MSGGAKRRLNTARASEGDLLPTDHTLRKGQNSCELSPAIIFSSKLLFSTAMLIGLLTCASQPAHAQSCTYWVAPAPTGSDGESWYERRAVATLHKAFIPLVAGQTVCFYGGTYPENPNLQCNTDSNGRIVTPQIENNSGSANSPITFTNVSGQVALIQGSTEIHGSYIRSRDT